METQQNIEQVEKKLPIVKLKDGAFELASWENKYVKDGDEKTFTSLTLQRTWKDKEEQWHKEVIKLNLEDCLKISLLLQEGYKQHKIQKL